MALNIPANIMNIQTAIRRYLQAYRRNFKGSTTDYNKLNNLTIEKLKEISVLSPRFFSTKLFTLVNQAATRLNLNPKDVDNNHRIFLLILDSLILSQPSGDIDFETEKKHIDALDKLHKKQKELRARERTLMATECTLGDDDKTYTLLSETQKQLFNVSKNIAKMHNIREEETPFNLVPKPDGGLDMLQKRHLRLYQLIDNGIKEIMSNAQKGRTKRELPDRETIKQLVRDSLSIHVSPEEAKFILEEVYSALRDYFRMLATRRTSETHDYYTSSKHLLPREGEILTDPDNLPPVVAYQLNINASVSETKMNNLFSSFARKRAIENNTDGPNKILALENGPVRINSANQNGEESDDCDIDDEEDSEDEEDEEDSSGDDDDVEILDIGLTKNDIQMLVRVKEEPLDDDRDDDKCNSNFDALEELILEEPEEHANLEPAPVINRIPVRRAQERSQDDSTNILVTKPINPKTVRLDANSLLAPVTCEENGSNENQGSNQDLSQSQTKPQIDSNHNIDLPMVDPFLDMAVLLKPSLATENSLPVDHNEESSGDEDDYDEEADDQGADDECRVIRRVEKDDKIQTVDLIDDD